MHTADYMTQERGAPAVLAIAVNCALIYLLAAGLGVVPAPLPRITSTLVDVPQDTVKPQPAKVQPIDPHILNTPFTTTDLRNKPIIEITRDLIPLDSERPTIDSGAGDPRVEPLTNARLLKSPEPPYPSFSRLSGEEGVVYVKVSISPYGMVGDASIEKSSGFARLDEAALKAVRAWRFAPAMRGTQAIATWVVVPVRYVLNGRG